MNKLNVVMTVKDERGDIEIYKRDDSGYGMRLQMEDVSGMFWEDNEDSFPTLAEAVSCLSEILQMNVDNDFYVES